MAAVALSPSGAIASEGVTKSAVCRLTHPSRQAVAEVVLIAATSECEINAISVRAQDQCLSAGSRLMSRINPDQQDRKSHKCKDQCECYQFGLKKEHTQRHCWQPACSLTNLSSTTHGYSCMGQHRRETYLPYQALRGPTARVLAASAPTAASCCTNGIGARERDSRARSIARDTRTRAGSTSAHRID